MSTGTEIDPKDAAIASLTAQVEQQRAALVKAREQEDKLREETEHWRKKVDMAARHALAAEARLRQFEGRTIPGDDQLIARDAPAPRRRKGEPYSPPRPAASEAEIEGFNETRDREAEAVGASLLAAISTLGVPGIWGEVLKVGAPTLLKTGSALTRALHPDSPGGKKLTRRELRAIAEGAADDLGEDLWDAFAERLTADGAEDSQ